MTSPERPGLKPHQIGILVSIALVLGLSVWVVWRAKHMFAPAGEAPSSSPSAAPHAH